MGENLSEDDKNLDFDIGKYVHRVHKETWQFVF